MESNDLLLMPNHCAMSKILGSELSKSYVALNGAFLVAGAAHQRFDIACYDRVGFVVLHLLYFFAKLRQHGQLVLTLGEDQVDQSFGSSAPGAQVVPQVAVFALQHVHEQLDALVGHDDWS